MKMVRATEQDSERLKAFFQKMVLHGPVDFAIVRNGSFFDQYRLQSDDYETLMLVDNKEQITGMATLVFRRGFIQGEKATWCLATDLRIARNREAVLRWTREFVPAFQEACSERNCRTIFSAIEHSRSQAYNALIRPTRQSRRKMPRYLLLNRFHVVNLHGRVPFAPKPLASIRIKTPEMEDIAPLCQYLRSHADRRPLAHLTDPEEFLAQINSWPGLSLADFRIALDSRDNIIGSAALWNAARTQSFIPQAYHGIAQTYQQSLNISSLLGLARPVASIGKPMQVRMLTHLICESAEVFHRIADEAFSRLGPKEFLSYGYFRGHWRTLPPRSFLSSSIPYGFYLILPPGDEPPALVAPEPQWLPPEFEVAWL